MFSDDARLSWLAEDPALVQRLNLVWPEWQSGLAATLDQQPGWNGWDQWDEPSKRNALAAVLDQWYPSNVEPAAVDTSQRVAWVAQDPALMQRLNLVSPEWQSGLAATLDQQPGWNGWDQWDEASKRNALAAVLDQWYPPNVEPAAVDTSVDPSQRVAWVAQDPALMQRLNLVWPEWQSGLAATLDQQPGWNGWDQWDEPSKRNALAAVLDQWYPPNVEPAAVATDRGFATSDGKQPVVPASEDIAAHAGDAPNRLAAIIAEARGAVPGAERLSDEQMTRILSELIDEESATASS